MALQQTPTTHPLRLLEQWLSDARAGEVSPPHASSVVTVGEDGQPSTRIVQLKRVETDALIFTSALWTRKAREIAANPRVSLLAYWPTLGRQLHLTGEAVLAERALADELFAGRELSRQLQAIVSRQGEPIEDLEQLRDRHAHLMKVTEAAPDRPPEWGAIRIVPNLFEFWSESEDRMHDRLLYERDAKGESWRRTRIAP
jgi:pyridoxamine 5'-phosphate oxidase